MKLPAYRQAVLVACSFGLLLLPMGCYQVSVSFEPPQPETSSPPTTEASSVSPSPQILPTLTPTSQAEGNQHNHPDLTSPHNSSKKVAPGTLRMSNRTAQAVRLALLARRSTLSDSGTGQSKYDVPAHWDFAPQEGSEKGLILSLPKKNLKLEKGDILVAFAQDGSRRYWGPYVVGETSSPTWNPENGEWQLVLNP
ncbi:MAG: hypothetical protein PUP92_02605 [Rhizonema sp. PD38]|nr:hypothetical protein [Rhizonema sp. PD38]